MLTSGSNNIYLGHSGMGIESGTLRLGNVQTRAFIKGVFGTVVSGTPVVISNTGQLGVLLSSARYKQDIEPLAAQSAKVHKLRPVTFHYKAEPTGPVQYGLIAEEVAQVYPELVTRDTNGQIMGVRYEALTPLLLKELQGQHRQIAVQDQKLATQAQQLTVQAQQIQAVLQQVAAQAQQMAELKAQNDTLRAAVERLQGAEPVSLTSAAGIR